MNLDAIPAVVTVKTRHPEAMTLAGLINIAPLREVDVALGKLSPENRVRAYAALQASVKNKQLKVISVDGDVETTEVGEHQLPEGLAGKDTVVRSANDPAPQSTGFGGQTKGKVEVEKAQKPKKKAKKAAAESAAEATDAEAEKAEKAAAAEKEAAEAAAAKAAEEEAKRKAAEAAAAPPPPPAPAAEATPPAPPAPPAAEPDTSGSEPAESGDAPSLSDL